MNISAKTDYACRALIELSLHWPKTTPLGISAIAKGQKIPIKFLTQILVDLKRLQLVESIRGQKGGYLLLKSPKEILLSDVVIGFENVSQSKGAFKKSKQENILKEIWEKAERQYIEYVAQINFEDLLIQYRGLTKTPMYAI